MARKCGSNGLFVKAKNQTHDFSSARSTFWVSDDKEADLFTSITAYSAPGGGRWIQADVHQT